MLRKGFHIGESQTKSRISFAIPENEPHRKLKRTLFRDPAAIPMLQGISDALEKRGYEVTKPKPGKSCHGFFRVALADVEISVVMLVRRRRGNIEFVILSWPSQSLRQRIVGRRIDSPDCPEWEAVCSAIHSILSTDARLKSLSLSTFKAEENAE